jgi:glyoxylase-like metal-dependent hydrolase (beta-lactamase superfamily II)
MEAASEIAPNIHRIPALFFGTRIVTCHLLIGQTHSLLVDTGMSDTPEKYILPYMKHIGFNPKQLTFIMITHSDIDHQEGNEAIRAAAPNALFMCHNLDRPWVESMEALDNGRYRQWSAEHGIGQQREGNPASYKVNVPMDITFEGGETIRLGPDWAVEIVHTPGHTWGHSGIYDPESRTFVAGESALWNAILDENWQPALPPTYCYVDPYIATIERLRSMDIETYSGAHWPLTRGKDVGAFLNESKNYALHVEQQLLDAINDVGHPIALKELIKMLKSNIGTWPADQDDNLAFPLHGNLRRLEDRGQIVRRQGKNGLVEWTAAHA